MRIKMFLLPEIPEMCESFFCPHNCQLERGGKQNRKIKMQRPILLFTRVNIWKPTPLTEIPTYCFIHLALGSSQPGGCFYGAGKGCKTYYSKLQTSKNRNAENPKRVIFEVLSFLPYYPNSLWTSSLFQTVAVCSTKSRFEMCCAAGMYSELTSWGSKQNSLALP